MSRVNKGRRDDPEFAMHAMFPDQDPEELDDDLLDLRTSKLPIYFAGIKRIPESMRRSPFGKPTLSATLLSENRVDESFIEDLAKGVSSASDFIGSFIGAARPISKVASKAIPAGAGTLALGAIPGFDVLYGSISSYYNYKQIQKNISRLDILIAAAGLDVDFVDFLLLPDDKFKSNADRLLSDIDSNEILEEVKKMLGNYKDIAVSLIMMSDTLTGAAFAGPLGIASTAATSAAALATTFTTDYEAVIDKLVRFFSNLKGAARSLVEKGLNHIDPGMDYDKFLKILQRTGELYKILLENESSGSSQESLYVEAKKKKRKPTLKNEFSGVGAVAGYVAPMSDFPTPARRKEFEKVAFKTFGGAKKVDERIDESAKFIVNGRRSLIKALLD